MNLAFGLILGSLLAQAGVPAAPLSGAEFQWSAPRGCPDRDTFLAGIAARRGRPLASGQAHIVARTTVTTARRFRLDLDIRVGARGEARVLTARTCVALVDAAALLIALALDGPAPVGGPAADLAADPPDVAPTVNEPPPASDVDEPRPAAPPGPSTAPPVPAAAPGRTAVRDAPHPEPPHPRVAPRRGPGGFVRLQGVGELGALPGPSGGLGLAGGLLWRRLRVELRAGSLAPRTVVLAPAEVRVLLFTGGVLGCARVGRGVLEVPVCAGLEFGGMHGRAAGAGANGASLRRWLAAALGVGVTWRVHPRVALWTALEGFAAIQRATFVLRDPGPEVPLFDPGILSVRLGLGVELRFGDPW